MGGSNGNLPSGLVEIMAGLEELIAAKEREVAVITLALDAARDELKPLYAMQRAALGTGPGRKPGKKVERTGVRQGEEELAIMVAKLRKLPEGQWADPAMPGSFAARTLRDLGVSDHQADRMIKALRLREQVRLVGERQLSKGSRVSNIYVLNDE